MSVYGLIYICDHRRFHLELINDMHESEEYLMYGIGNTGESALEFLEELVQYIRPNILCPSENALFKDQQSALDSAIFSTRVHVAVDPNCPCFELSPQSLVCFPEL